MLEGIPGVRAVFYIYGYRGGAAKLAEGSVNARPFFTLITMRDRRETR